MRRIGLAVVLALSLVLAPLAVDAQQASKVWRIGFLALLPAEDVTFVKILKQRLLELRYIEGRNLIFEYRSAEGRQERLAELAMELAQARPDVLIAGSGTLAPLALKRTTTTIPIVFVSVGDPVGAGVVTSLAKPGGNVTGVTGQSADLAAKRLQLLQDVAPAGQIIAVLVNPATPFSQLALKETRAAAEILRVRLEILELTIGDQTASRFETAVRASAAGMIVFSDPLTTSIRQQIADLATKFRLPTICTYREFAEVGCLISYGPSRRDMYRKTAKYVDKVLRGTKPADLPVEQPTKFELIINLKTAKALGLSIPQSILVRADELIQ